MKPGGNSTRRPATTAFVVWFAHFMLCWVAVEFRPFEPLANQLAWGATAVALLALGVHVVHLERWADHGELAAFNRRFARGAVTIAAVAILFTAFPSLVFRA